MNLPAAALLLFACPLAAQVPNLIPQQGRVAVNGVNFDGTGQFKFALVNAAGNVTYWSNNGSSTAGSQPTAAVALPVTKGLYSALLGDTTLANMTAVPASVYANADLRLRVWFNNGTLGFQQLTPDQRLAPNGYLPDGIVAGSKLADGAVTAAKLAPGAVSQLGAPDGSPLAALQVNADGQVGVGTSNPLAGLHIASTRDVQNLDLVSVRKDESGGYTTLNGAWEAAAAGNLLAVAASGVDSGVTLMDITDPAAPVLRWQVHDGENGYDYLAGVWKVAMKPGLLAVAANLDNAVTLINVADPASPVKLAELRDGVGGYNGLGQLVAISISGNLMAIASGVEQTVTLVDITNPAAPVKRAEIVNGAGGYSRLGGIESIAMSGSLLAIGSTGEAVTLVDVIAPAAPIMRAEILSNSPGYEALRRMTGMALSGGLLAVASQNTDAITLVDVSNPAGPVRRAVLQWNVNTMALDSVVAVSLSGTQMFTGGRGVVAAWDVSNPASPVELGVARQGSSGLQSLFDCWGVTIAGGNFVATSQGDGAVNVFALRSHASSLTTTGWAGIGTARPEAALHVLGNARVDGAERVEFNTSHFEAGNGTAANGFGATAMGLNSVANGTVSLAIGENALAHGNYSAAIGRNAYAQQQGSIALGSSARALGPGAVALGTSEASGNSATSMGGGTVASGNYATAAGYSSGALGYASTALGVWNLSSGDTSFAAGTSAQALHNNTFVWSAGTPVFPFASTAANQFLIQAGGGVGINTNNPDGAALAVNGNITFTGSLAGSGAGLTGLNAANLTGSVPGAALTVVPAASLTGSVPPAALTSVPAASLTGTVPGAALTSVPAPSLTGTIAEARLPASAALRNAPNNFTGNQTITGSLGVTGSVAMGSSNSATGFAAVALGGSSQASGNYSMAIGNGAATTAGNSIALGMSTTAAHTGSFVWADALGTPFTTTFPNQFIIRASSGVGIGTNSPQAPLQIGDVNVAGSQGVIRLASRSSTTNLYNSWDVGVFKHDTNYLGRYFSFNIDNPGLGTQPEMTIRWDNGNTGIGTENPAAKLHVYSADNPTVMRIQSTGAPGFGRLEFVSNPQFNANEWRPAYIQSTDGGGFTGGLGFVTNGTGAANKFGEVETMRLQNGLTGLGRVASANRLEVEGNASKSTAGSWLANSDRRIKTDITPVTGALATLEKVRPVTFRYTEDYRKAHPDIKDVPYYNVIAQEFREVFPNSVKSSGEKLPDGSEILQVDTYPATITAIAAINELKAENEALKQRLAALEDIVRGLQPAVSKRQR